MKQKRGMTPEKIERWIKEGRGQGDLQNYKPWLTHRDVPSKGWRIRIPGFITHRKHIMLSKEEAKICRALDLSPRTRDIKEQFPLLPLEVTLSIAKNLGIKHPADPVTKNFIVMTTDFLWCIDGNPIPLDSKPSPNLANPRTIEKFEITRAFWKIRGMDWKLSTELDIPAVVAENCQRFHPALYLDGLKISRRDIDDIARLMTQQVLQREKPLRIIARDTDNQLGLCPGTCLRTAFHFIARRYWRVDWYKPQEAETTIEILEIDNNFDFSMSFLKPPAKD